MVDPASVENLVQDSPLKIPPLESGDRLSRAEFERRYEAMPHLKKAELIEGVVYVPAALRFRVHKFFVSLCYFWFTLSLFA